MNTILFLQETTTYTPSSKKEKISIILSPFFYWVRRFIIPTVSLSSALEIVPILFGEYFDTTGYSFYLKKIEKHSYLAFAYNETLLTQYLQKANIPLKKIKNIYFAHNEFASYTIDDEQKDDPQSIFFYNDEYYTYHEALLVKIPSNLIAQSSTFIAIDPSTIPLSNHSFHLNSYQKFKTNQPMLYGTIFLFLFGFLFLIQGIIHYKASFDFPQKIISIQSQHNLPSTLIETRSLLDGFTKTQNNLENYQNANQYLLSIDTSSLVMIESLVIDHSTIEVIYKRESIEQVTQYIKAKYKKANISQTSDAVKVRITL